VARFEAAITRTRRDAVRDLPQRRKPSPPNRPCPPAKHDRPQVVQGAGRGGLWKTSRAPELTRRAGRPEKNPTALGWRSNAANHPLYASPELIGWCPHAGEARAGSPPSGPPSPRTCGRCWTARSLSRRRPRPTGTSRRARTSAASSRSPPLAAPEVEPLQAWDGAAGVLRGLDVEAATSIAHARLAAARKLG
jgi:hypothetical protein